MPAHGRVVGAPPQATASAPRSSVLAVALAGLAVGAVLFAAAPTRLGGLGGDNSGTHPADDPASPREFTEHSVNAATAADGLPPSVPWPLPSHPAKTEAGAAEYHVAGGGGRAEPLIEPAPVSRRARSAGRGGSAAHGDAGRQRAVLFLHKDTLAWHLAHFAEMLVVASAELNAIGLTHADVAVACMVYARFPASDARSNTSWLTEPTPARNELRRVLFRVFPGAGDTAALRSPDDDKACRDEPPPNAVRINVRRGDYSGGGVNKMILKAMRGFDEWAWHRALVSSATAAASADSATPVRLPGRRSARWEGLPWIKSKVVVTYIERSDPERRLSDAARNALVGLLSSYPNVDFRRVRMEEHTMGEQMDIAAGTDVLIGVHGNGLTHQLFMHPGGFVCEIFPKWKRGHQFDYQYLAKSMGHDYLAVSNGEPQVVWRWGLRHRNGTGWDSADVLWEKSSTSDLSERALDAIASLVFHASEQVLDHDTRKG